MQKVAKNEVETGAHTYPHAHAEKDKRRLVVSGPH